MENQCFLTNVYHGVCLILVKAHVVAGAKIQFQSMGAIMQHQLTPQHGSTGNMGSHLPSARYPWHPFYKSPIRNIKLWVLDTTFYQGISKFVSFSTSFV